MPEEAAKPKGDAKPAAAAPTGTAAPSSKSVLIVDDDETILNLLEILVRRDGFRVLRAESGEAAVYLLSKKPDALLLDLMLPGAKSGLDVLAHLRGLSGPAPTVIMITGQVDSHPELMEARKNPLVTEVLHKPINQEKLLGLLHRTLKTRAPERKEQGRKWQE